MKKYLIRAFLFGGLLFSTTRCELLDPTQGVENPNLTFESILGTPASTTRWLNGQERQMAITYNGLVHILEIASDNYDNTATFFNQAFDGLTFDFKDADVNTLQFRIADLRSSAAIGLDMIIPADPTATDDQRAEMHFYRGWAQLLAGEIFVALPNSPAGVPVAPATNIANAIIDFTAAEQLDADNASYKLALARAYYALGDEVNAGTKAAEAIALSPAFTRTVKFDVVNGLTNTMQDALFDRGTFDDLQPLPRLDFLDPKYYGRNATTESQIYIQKIEEAHLILAEIALAGGSVAAAQPHLTAALDVVNARAKESFSDASEGRTQAAPGSRPNTSTAVVRASETDPFRAGLVLTRSAGNVNVPVISGTSVTAGMIGALATTDEGLELLYLMRQEIFIAEGRRFSDLGMRLSISEVEKLQNTNVTDQHLTAFVPTFIPTDMDAITYNAGTGEVTIKHNMNRVLVQNKTAASVLPFN